MELKEKELSNDLNPNCLYKIRKQARKSLVQLAGEIIHLKGFRFGFVLTE